MTYFKKLFRWTFVILFLITTSLFAQSEGNAVSFTGTDDYVSFSSTADANAFDVTGSFTLEAWIYMNDIVGNQSIVAKRDISAATPPSNTNYALRVDSGALRFFWRASDNTLIDCFENDIGQASITAATWYHVAAVFDSTTMTATLFVDGTNVYSTTMDSLPEVNDYPLIIGAYYNSGGPSYDGDFDGVIDELRISDNVRYTGNFSLPTKPYLSDANTVALFHFDKAAGLSQVENFVSVLSNYDGTLQGGASYTTSAPSLGTSADNSMSFDGSDDYFNSGDSTALDITGNITVEAWVQPSALNGSRTVVSKWDPASSDRSYLLSVEDGTVHFVVSSDGTAEDTISSAITLQTDRWAHLAGVYDGSTLQIYVNGQLDSSRAYSAGINAGAADLEIGSYNGANLFAGYIDEVRISDTNRYSTDFTLPSQNHISDANTVLLIHASHSSSETVGIDASGNDINVSSQGGAGFSSTNYLDVNFSAGINNPGDSNESASGLKIPMVQFVIDATNTSEDLIMRTVQVTASGTANDSSDIATNGVLLYRDINENGTYEEGTDQYINSAAGFPSDNGTVTINTNTYQISQGSTVSFLVVYDLAGTATDGETFISSVDPLGIDLEGDTSSDNYTAIGTTVTGGIKTISTSRSLTISEGVSNPISQNVSDSAQNHSALQIQLTASSSDDVLVDSLKLVVSGTLDHTTMVDSIDLYHDLNDNGIFDTGVDTAIVTGVSVGAADSVLFAGVSKTIAAGESQNWIVLYSLNGTATGSETFSIEVPLDAVVYGNATVSGAPVSGSTFTISSVGQITLAAGAANPGASTEGVQAQNIVVLQFELSANDIEDVGIYRMEFSASGSGNDAGDFTAALYRDVNSNGVYESGTDVQFGSSSTFNSDNGTLIFNILPDADTLIASDSRNYILVYDFNENATEGETYQAQILTSGIMADGITSGSPVTILGSTVDGGLKTISNIGSLSLSFNGKPPASSVTADATNAPIYQLVLTASSTENISMESITFEEIGTANAANDILPNGIELYRDVDDDGIVTTGVDQFIGSSQNYGGYEVTFDGAGDYIALDANQDDIGGTGSNGITVEAWVYIPTAASGTHIIASTDRSEYWRLSVNAARRILWATNADAGGQGIDDMTGNAQLAEDTWNHVAAVYEPSTGQKRIYINGNIDATTQPYTPGTVLGSPLTRFGFIGTGSEATTYNGTNTPNQWFHGNLEEFRISSTVRYTSSFTPQTTPYTPDSDTEILFHFNEGSGATTANAAISSGVGDGGLYDGASFTDATKVLENITTISTTGQTISASTTSHWLLAYDLADSALAGETFQARVPSQYSISASGETFGQPILPTGSFPLNGNAQTVSDIGALSMNLGSSSPSGQQIPNAVQDMEMLQLQLTASGAESLHVQTVTIKGNGSGSELTDVDSVFYVVDLNNNGVYDSGVDLFDSLKYAFTTDNGTIAISIDDTLEPSETKNYLFVYDFAGTASNNQTFSTSIDLNSYITATGISTSSPATVSGAPVNGSTMTIQNAPELTLMPGVNNPGAGNVANNATDVEMIQFNLTASAGEDIDISSVKFIDIGTGDESTAIDTGDVRLYRDVNGNGALDPVSDILLATGTSFLNGNPGNATNYDGLNDYTNIPDDNNLDITGDLTIEAWIYPSQASGGTYTVVAKRDFGAAGTPTNYSLRVDDYRMRFFFYSPDGILRDCFDDVQLIFPGNWYHIAGVYDATANQMRLYVNGNLVQTADIGDNDPLANTYPLNIGRRYRSGFVSGGDSYFNGVIDELRLSNSIRYTGSQFSVSQVPFTADANTRLLLHFDDSIGSSTVADSSGNGLDGTLVNGTSLTESSAPLFGGMTLSLSGVSISAGENEDWLLLYDFNGTAAQSETFQSRVLRPVDIQAVGATSGLNANLSGLPVTGGEMTILDVGDLTVHLGTNTPPSENIAADAADAVMMQFELTAGSVEDIEVNSIVFNAQGSGHDINDLVSNSIRLYEDVNSNGAFDSGTDLFIGQGTAFDADNGNVTIATTGQIITASTSENWILLYSFADSASSGETFFSRIVQNTDITAVGATSSSTIVPASADFPISGNPKTISTVGSITLSEGGSNPPNSLISNSDTNVEMLQLQLSASSAESLKIAQLEFKANGTGDDVNDISAIYLYNDLNDNGDLNLGVDTLIASTGSFPSDNGNITFTFADSILFPAGETQNWLLVYDMAGSAANGLTFQANVELSTYLVASGIVTDQSANVNGSFPVSSALKTISDVGTITIVEGASNPGAGTEAANAVNIEMLQLNLTASAAESLLVDTLTFTALGSIDELNDVTFVTLYRDVNSNGTLDLTIDEQIDSARAFTADNGTVTFATKDTLPPSSSADLLVVYNLSGSASGGETFRVRLDVGNAVVKGVESAGDATVQGLPLTSAEQTVTDVGGLTLSVGASNPGNSNITADAQDVAMVQFNLAASSVEDVGVSSVTFRHSGTADPVSDILENQIDLYVDNGNGVFDPGTDVFIGTGARFQNYGINLDGMDGYLAMNADDSQAGGTTSNGLTVEAYVRYASGASGTLIIASLDRSEYWRLALNAARRVVWATNADAGGQGIDDMTGSQVLSADTWYHVAAVYDASTGQKRIYIDGQLDAMTEPYTDGTVLGSATTRYGFIGVGSEATTFNGTIGPASYFEGDIDEFRISNTVRYTSNFTPPTEDFSSDGNTAVLHHFSENSGTITNNSATTGGAGNSQLNGGASFIESNAYQGTTVTIATTGQIINAGSNEDWLLVYDLADSASIGETFIASVLRTGIVADGQTSGSNISAGGNNVSGGIKTVSAVGSLTLTAGVNNPDASTEAADAQNLSMFQLQLEPSTAESLLVSEFSIKGEGTADESVDVTDVTVYRDVNSNGVYDDGVDVQIGAPQSFSIDDGVITWTFAPAETLIAGVQENWLVAYNLGGSAANGETMQARMELASYMTVTGLSSSQSITPGGSFAIVGGIKSISNIGRIQVSLGASTPAEGNVALDAQDVEVLQLRFATNSAESLRVDSLYYTPQGTMNHLESVSSARLYDDVNGNGILDLVSDILLATSSYSDSLGSLIFTLADTLPPNATKDYLLVYDLSGLGSINQNFRATIAVDADVYATGLSGAPHAGTIIGPPIQGNYLTLSGQGTLTVSEGPANPGPTNETNDVQSLAVLQFNLAASNVEGININSITLTAAGTADDVNDISASGIKLYRDVNSNGTFDNGVDEFITQGNAYATDNGTVLLTTTGQTIAAGTSEDWLVTYDLAGSAEVGETFIARLLQSSDISATGVTSSQSITATGSLPVVGGTKTISAIGSLTLAVGSNSPINSNISNSDQNIEMLQLQMSASAAETLLVSEVQFKAAGTGVDQTDISGIIIYHDLNNNGVYDSGVDTALTGQETYPSDNGNVVFTFVDSVEIPAGATQNWLVLYNMAGTAADNATFSFAIELASYVTVTGKSSGMGITPVGSYPISSATKTVTSIGVLTVTAGLNNPIASVEANNAVNIEMLQLNLEASAAESLLVDTLTFTSLGSINELTDVTFVNLYRDVNSNGTLDLTIDEQIDSARAFTADNGTVTFATKDTLPPSSSVDLLVVYNLSGSASGGETFRVRLDVGDAVVTGVESAGDATVQGLPLTSAEKTVTDVGGLTLSVGASNPGNSNITADAPDVAMVQFNLAASSVEDVGVSSVTFRHSGTADPATDILENQIDLYVDNGNGIYDPGSDVFIGTGTKFQNYGINLDGTDGYLAMDATSTQVGGTTSSGLTVEAYVRYASGSSGELIIASLDRSEYWRLSLNGARRVYWSTNADAGGQGINDMTGSQVLSADTWYHVAAVYEASTGEKRIYINGQLDAMTEPYTDGTVLGSPVTRYGFIGVGSEATTFNGTIGPANYFEGDIDEFRISNTVRYTSNFTPPTEDFAADANTALLHHFSENGGTIANNSATSGGAGNSQLNGGASFIESDAYPGTTVTIATTGQIIDAGSNEDWLLVYDLSDSASIGETFIASVLRTGIVSDGQTSGSNISADGNNVSGGVKTVSLTGNMTIANGGNNPQASNIAPNDLDVVMQQIAFTASSAETLVVSQFQVKASGTGDESTGVDSVGIYFDADGNGQFTTGIDELLAPKQEVTQDDEVFTFATSDTIPAGTTRNWIVLYDFSAGLSNGETFRTGVELNSYVTAEGFDQTSREVTGAPIYGQYKTVSDVGVLTIQTGAQNPVAHSEGSAATNIEVLQIELSTSSAESLAVQSIKFTSSGTMDESTDVLNVRLYHDVNDNGLLDLTQDIQLGSNQTFTTDDDTVKFSLAQPESLQASTTVNWLIVYDLTGSASNNETFRLSVVNNADISVSGIESGQPANVLGAPVNGNYITVLNVGALTIRTGVNNPGNSNETADATNLEMLQINLQVSSVENVRIDSIRFSAAGTAHDVLDIISSGVRIYLDDGDGQYEPGVDNLIGSQGDYNADNGYFTLVTGGEVINIGQPEYWLMVYDLNNTAGQNETFIARLLEAADVYAVGVTSDSSAIVSIAGDQAPAFADPDPGSEIMTATFSDKKLGSKFGKDVDSITSDKDPLITDAPIVGGTKTITTVGSLTLALGASNPTATQVGASESQFSSIQVNLSAGNPEDVDVSSIRFTATGTLHDVDDVSNVQLYNDLDGDGGFSAGDTQIGTDQTFDADNGSVVFSGLSETITAGASETWILLYNLNGNASTGETFASRIALETHVTATGSTTSQSITPSGIPVNGNTHTVSANGTLTLSAGGSMPGASNEDANATDVSMFQMNMAASSVEDITVTSIRFIGQGTGTEATEVSAVRLYEDRDNDGQYTAGTDTLLGTQTYPVGNDTVTFGGLNIQISSGSNQNWIVVYDFSGAANGNTFRVRFDSNDDVTVTSGSGNPSVIGAPFTGNYKTISITGSLTLSEGANNPGDATIDRNQIEVEMLQINLSTGSVEDVDITRLVITHQGTGDPVNDIVGEGVLLARDVNNNGTYEFGTDVVLADTSFLAGDTARFELSSVSISAGSNENWLIVYDFDGGSTHNSTYQARVISAASVTATGATSSNPVVPDGSYPVQNGTVTLTAFSNMSIAATDLPASPLPGDQNVALMQLDLTVDQNISTIYSIQVDNRASIGTADGADVDSIKIYLESGATGGFQPAEDIYQGADTCIADGSGGSSDITFLSQLDVDNTGATLYVVYDISPTANLANSVGVLINSTAYLSVETPETILDPSDFPIQTLADYSLPVELVSFTATGDHGFVSLEWITESELNNLGFILERKNTVDTEYQQIASYQTHDELRGQGNSSEQHRYNFKDDGVQAEIEYSYRLIQMDIDGSQTVLSHSVKATALEPLPSDFTLSQNYPNPFNPETKIAFSVPQSEEVTLIVYDILGNKVVEILKNERYEAGNWTITWDGNDNYGSQVASGLYFYTIRAGKFTASKKMTMLK